MFFYHLEIAKPLAVQNLFAQKIRDLNPECKEGSIPRMQLGMYVIHKILNYADNFIIAEFLPSWLLVILKSLVVNNQRFSSCSVQKSLDKPWIISMGKTWDQHFFIGIQISCLVLSIVLRSHEGQLMQNLPNHPRQYNKCQTRAEEIEKSVDEG